MGNVNTVVQIGVDCGRLGNPENSEYCLRELSLYKKVFFTDRYGNTKEKISFSDYLNHYKSAGYVFPKEAIGAEAERFYIHANGHGYESKTCWGCGNGDGLMDSQEMYRRQTHPTRATYVHIINHSCEIS